MGLVADIASVAGLILAVVSLWMAAAARKAVAQVRRRESLYEHSLSIQRAIHASRELQQSAASRWPQRRCDELREALSEVSEAPWLGPQGGKYVRAVVAELRESRENDAQAAVWIREVIDFLIQAKRRVRQALSEIEP
jgi:hypothetical protein